MNAVEFIKQHGVDKAGEVVEGAPVRANWYQVKGKYSNDLYSCNHELYGEAIMLSDLKRLVDSVDLVEHFGNDLVGAKQLLEFSKDCITIELSGSVITVERLKQAIADYEQIFGCDHVVESNKCEILDHPEDYTSPNCKKIDIEQVK